MKPSLFNLILTVLAGIVLIVPFTGKVYDGRSKWFKRFTIRGWILCAAVIGSIIVNYYKDEQVETDDLIKADIVKKEKKTDKAMSDKKTNESNAKIVSAFTTALAQYGLKYDSTQKVIQTLVRDSTKKEVKVVNAQPNINVCGISLVNKGTDSCKFKIEICCKYAPSLKTYMKMNIALEKNDGSMFLCKVSNQFYLHGSGIPADKKLTYFIDIPDILHETARFYFLLLGKYEGENGYKHILNDYTMYDLSKNGYGIPYEPHFSKGLNYFNERGIK
jgi:hypothetical protein